MKRKFYIAAIMLCMMFSLNGCNQNSETLEGNNITQNSSEAGADIQTESPAPIATPAPLTTLEKFFKNGPVCVQAPNNLWGYIDINGNYVIEPKYKYASAFSLDGIAVVQDHSSGLYGYIDTSGQYIIEPQYIYASIFSSEGIAVVQDRSTGLYGYIDTSEKYIIEPQYIAAYPFSQDMALVKDGNFSVKYIDISGRYVLEIPGCDEGTSFSNDRAFVHNSSSDMDDTEWAMIDLSGNFLTDYIFYMPSYSKGDKINWTDDLCFIQTFYGVGYVCINIQGEIVAPKDGGCFNRTRYFSDGLASVLDSETMLWGYIDTSGEWAIPPQFTDAQTAFHDGYAWASDQSGLYGIIDKDANWIMLPAYQDIDFSGGNIAVYDGERYKLIDMSGTVLEEYDFEAGLSISLFSNVLRVGDYDYGRRGYYCQFYKLDGSPIIDANFYGFKTAVYSDSGLSYAVVEKDGLYGVIDDTGWLIAANYLDIKL